MDSEIARVSAQIPLMSCWRLGKLWTGFLRLNDKLLRLTINVPKFPTIQGIKLDGDEELKAICHPEIAAIERLAQEGLSLFEFMNQFQAMLKDRMENRVQISANANSAPVMAGVILNPEFYAGLLEEFYQIRHEKISFVSDDYCEIHVTHLDVDGREHVLRFYLSKRYPYASLKVIADLPVEDPRNIVWPNKISDATKQFKSELAKYIDFWNEMELLDETRVIDPARPNFSHTYRRILIDEKILLHLTVNPLKPRQYPEIQITGPEKPVSSLLHLLRTNSNMWNESNSVLNNLQNILEIQFLPKICTDDDNAANEETDLNCTICYMYDLEGEVPERTCVCSAAFHNRCLYDLYVSDFLGTGKKYIDCPVCSEGSRMDRYHLMHRTKCRWIVITEMVLAGVRVLAFSLSRLQFVFYSSTSSLGSHPSEDSHLSEFIAHYWMVFLCVLGVDVILLILGKKVLLACREVGKELRKAISACRVWCRLELFRMLIFVITFLVDVYEQQFNMHQYMLQIPTTIVLLFGWFFVNEYRKELTVKSASHLQMITQPVNGFQAIQEPRVVYFAPSVPNVYNFE